MGAAERNPGPGDPPSDDDRRQTGRDGRPRLAPYLFLSPYLLLTGVFFAAARDCMGRCTSGSTS